MTVDEEWISRSLPRIDGEGKVDGSIRFFSDLNPPGCLYAKTVRSPFPRARLRGIDVSKAEASPGVRCVVTHRDIRGLNGYGVFFTDAPVLCSFRVNYVGDPIALVAADSEDAAARGAELVEVGYEELSPIRSIEEALEPGAPALHPEGNVARSSVVRRGRFEKAIKGARHVLRGFYDTQKQKHMFIEPEAGLGYVDDGGVVNLFVGGQSPFRDVLQVSRSLGLPKEKVRVVSFPVGGAFGGKDEVTLQIHLALLALKARRPVKLMWSREESGTAGFMRHAFELDLETGFDKDGRIVANRAKLLADTGPYRSFGPAVLDVAMETSNGPYLVPNFLIEAKLVRTNNGLSGAFRGFGAPQSNFAIEGQMSAAAEKFGFDKVDLRSMNLWKSGEEGNFGRKLGDCAGLKECLRRASASQLWKSRGRLKPSRPWVKRGVGLSLAVKGVGFGTLPDYPSAAIEVDPRGQVNVAFSNPDYGQGLVTTNLQMVAERLGIPSTSVHVINADSGMVPDTGSSSASRSTYTSGNALLKACEMAISVLRIVAASELGLQVDELKYEVGKFTGKGKERDIFRLAKVLRSRGLSTRFVGTFEVPRHMSTVKGSLEMPHMIYNFAALVGEVEVNVLTGKVTAKRFMFLPDIGRVLNPVLASAQCDGGIIQGLGYALTEEHVYVAGVPKSTNFTTYLVPCPTDSPEEIYTEFVTSRLDSGPFGAKGVGEIPIIPVASCIADAVSDATGTRIRSIPLKPWKVLGALAGPAAGNKLAR
jgi:CO/xanthine dehydrogenase Mo-binding subunit